MAASMMNRFSYGKDTGAGIIRHAMEVKMLWSVDAYPC